MKVLILLRCDAFSKFGGDTLQAQKYHEALRRQSVEADLVAGVDADFGRYDVIHVFNLDRVIEPYLQAKRADDAGKPVVLSAIHHPDSWVRYFREHHAPWVTRAFEWTLAPNKRAEVLKDCIRCYARAAPWSGWWEEVAVFPAELQRKLLKLCHSVTLLGTAEARWIARDFGIVPSRTQVIQNAVEETASEEKPGAELAAFCANHPRFVLVCGRIEPRKNQLSILSALKEKHAVIFAGGLNPRAKQYGHTFSRAVRSAPRVFYAGQLSREQLAWLYRRAHVHVLFSWFEASPLVDLEAWQGGSHVVTTARSYSREYAPAGFRFVEPSEPATLRGVVDELMAQPRRENSAPTSNQRLNRSWDDAATELRALYEEVLATPKRHSQMSWLFPVV